MQKIIASSGIIKSNSNSSDGRKEIFSLWPRSPSILSADDCCAELDPKRAKLHQELAAMRRLAFVAVAISAVATLLAAFLVPFLHAQLQYVQSMAQEELDFCRMRTTNFWREISKTEVRTQIFTQFHVFIWKCVIFSWSVLEANGQGRPPSFTHQSQWHNAVVVALEHQVLFAKQIKIVQNKITWHQHTLRPTWFAWSGWKGCLNFNGGKANPIFCVDILWI